MKSPEQKHASESEIPRSVQQNSTAPPQAEKEDAVQTVDKTPDTDAEDKEAFERFLDTRLEYAILEHATKLNEGNNGLIFTLRMDGMEEDLKEDLAKMGLIDREKDTVAKILKIHRPGAGKIEFDNQQKAVDTLNAREGEEIAHVPELHFMRDIPLSMESRDALNRTSTDFRASERVEVILMDLVPGEDLWTLISKEVLRKHPDKTRFVQGIDSMPLDMVERHVADILGFKKPGGKARDEGERIHEQRKVESENKEKVFEYLKKSDVQLHPSVVAQMHNAVTALHESGMTVRDAHHRNFMIVGDLFMDPENTDAPAPQVFMIDFENSAHFNPGMKEQQIMDTYIRTAETEGVNHADPRIPERDIAPLSLSPETRHADEELGPARKLRKQLDDTARLLERRLKKTPNPKLTKYETMLVGIVSDGERASNDPRIYNIHLLHPIKMQRRVEATMVSLERLAAEGKIDDESVENFLKDLRPSLPQDEKVAVDNYLKFKKAT